jgi:hypothetical protein
MLEEPDERRRYLATDRVVDRARMLQERLLELMASGKDPVGDA